MKKKFINFLEKLSRDEMRTVTGADGYGDGQIACSCSCTDGSGAWSGIYDNYDQVHNSAISHCSQPGNPGDWYSCACQGSVG